MSLYLYLIHPYRHDLFAQPTPSEQAVLVKRQMFLEQARRQGQVLLTGLCLDETFALVILRAEDEQSASTFMFADPAVEANLVVAELHPFRLDFMGGQDEG